MNAKLKNVKTGEVVEVFSLTLAADRPELNGLVFSRERNRWEEIFVQRWNAVKGKADVRWIPAVPGVDF